MESQIITPLIASQMLGVHPSTLITYETTKGLKPIRTAGGNKRKGHRRYLLADILRIQAEMKSQA